MEILENPRGLFVYSHLNVENNFTHYYSYLSQKSLKLCRKMKGSVTGINIASNMNLLVKLKMKETT